jgi:cytochrome c biogenesis protein CcdA/glutaredoxin
MRRGEEPAEAQRRLRATPLLAILLAAVAALAGAAETRPARVTLEIFTRSGCSHCEAAKRFLHVLRSERPELDVVEHDVSKDPRALERLRRLSAEHGVEAPGVPAFLVGDDLVVGYLGPQTTGARLAALVDRAESEGRAEQWTSGTCLPEEPAPCPGAAPPRPAEGFEIRLLGHRLAPSDFGLPLFTFALGLLDGFNPCSMWVLILMLSMLASLGDRMRMLLVAGTFVAVEGVAYFAFMAAWLNAFLWIGLSRVSEIVLGGIAAAAGVVHVKDFWALGRGFSLSIPRSAKPGIYARMRRILVAENLTGALIGTVVLGVLVQVVELLCTSGFPALYTRILTARHLDPWSYYGYLLLYDLAYMLDDVIILGIGVATLSRRRLQEREGRWLKLVSGVVMIALGAYLIFAPWWRRA